MRRRATSEREQHRAAHDRHCARIPNPQTDRSDLTQCVHRSTYSTSRSAALSASGKPFSKLSSSSCVTSAFGGCPSRRAAFVTSARNGGIAAETSCATALPIAGRLDVSLAQVQDVAARLHLAGAPQVLPSDTTMSFEQIGARRSRASWR